MLVPPRVRSLLWSLFRQRLRLMLMLLAFATLQSAVSTVGDPVLMKWLVDTLNSGDMRVFAIIGCSAVVFYTLTRVLDYVYVVLKTRIRLGIMSDTCRSSTSLFYRLPYAQVKEHDKGYYTGRLLDEPKELSAILDVALDIYRAVIGFVAALVVCLWLSWQLALGISVVVPVLLYMARRYGKRISQSSKDVQESEARLRDTIGQLVGSYRLFNTFRRAALPMRQLDEALDKNVGARMHVTRQSSFFQLISSISLSYAEMAVLLAAGFSVITGHLTIGGLFGFMGAYWRAVGGVQRLIELTPQLARLEGIVERFDEFSQSARPSLPGQPDAAGHGNTDGDGSGPHDADNDAALPKPIRLEGVELAVGARVLFSRLGLQTPAAGKLLIVGGNGTGKSTLIDLLCGFRVPNAGSVELPATDTLSCQFTEPTFFPGTVRENIFEVDSVTGLAWLQRCELEGVADQQPYQLSAGQQRKLQIAMTLARETPYYIFDEPLANLDERSKPRYMQMIFERTAGKTLIVVMHGDRNFWDKFDDILDLNALSGGSEGHTAALEHVQADH